jgi:hypothetical protein
VIGCHKAVIREASTTGGPGRPFVFSLRLTPSVVTLAPGATQQFTTVITDAFGNTIPASPTYLSTGGTITAAGLYHAGATSGQYRIIATFAGRLADGASVTIGNSPAPDRVTLLLPAGPVAPLPVVLLDLNEGGGSGCRDDDHYTGDVIFPNWVAHGACGPDEITAFARGSAAVIDDGPGVSGQIWTDAAGEARVVDLQAAPRAAPVELWILDQFYKVQTSTGDYEDLPVIPLALHVLDHANTFYDRSRAGIRFVAGTPHQVWNNASAKAALGCYVSGPDLVCQCGPGVYGSAFFVAGKLNLYFVDEVLLKGSYAMGVNCRDPHSTTNPSQAGNVMLVSTNTMSLATVAHELGHALSLGHTGEGGGSVYKDPVTGVSLFDATNLMWSGVEQAFNLSLGQAFRMNVETMSELNLNGTRSGPTRACECRASDPTCDFVKASDTDGVCPRISRTW